MSKMLHSTVDVIEALGGTKAVAELTGRTYPAAFNWRYSKFPANTYLAIQSALKERGLEAPPELWGMTQSEDA
jgi:hypothetical protein